MSYRHGADTGCSGNWLRADGRPAGALHLLTQVRLEVEEIFLALGYRIADGPEIEDEYHNFTALNVPAGHPARSSSDTFYIEGELTALLVSRMPLLSKSDASQV